VKGKMRCQLVGEKAELEIRCYVDKLLPKLIGNRHGLVRDRLIFQQNYRAAASDIYAQQWFSANVRNT